MHKAFSILKPFGRDRTTLFELGFGPIRICWFKENDNSKRYLTLWWKKIERLYVPYSPHGVSSSAKHHALSVVSVLLCWLRRACLFRNDPKIHCQPKGA
jgi:hypothetical protein